eukprot:scaffold23553_cov101-Isochrysis_galbana.AAC.2
MPQLHQSRQSPPAAASAQKKYDRHPPHEHTPPPTHPASPHIQTSPAPARCQCRTKLSAHAHRGHRRRARQKMPFSPRYRRPDSPSPRPYFGTSGRPENRRRASPPRRYLDGLVPEPEPKVTAKLRTCFLSFASAGTGNGSRRARLFLDALVPVLGEENDPTHPVRKRGLCCQLHLFLDELVSAPEIEADPSGLGDEDEPSQGGGGLCSELQEVDCAREGGGRGEESHVGG